MKKNSRKFVVSDNTVLTTKKDDNCFELKGNDTDKLDQVASALVNSHCDKSDNIQVYSDNIEIPHFR